MLSYDDVDKLIIELDQITLKMCQDNNRPTLVLSQFKTISSRLKDYKISKNEEVKEPLW